MYVLHTRLEEGMENWTTRKNNRFHDACVYRLLLTRNEFYDNRPFMIYGCTYVGFQDLIGAQYMQQFHASPAPAQSFFSLFFWKQLHYFTNADLFVSQGHSNIILQRKVSLCRKLFCRHIWYEAGNKNSFFKYIDRRYFKICK